MHKIPKASPVILKQLSQRAKVVIFSGFGSLLSPVYEIIHKARDELMSAPELCEETLLVLLIRYDGICFKLKIDRDTYNLVQTTGSGAQTILYGYNAKDFGEAQVCDLVACLCELTENGHHRNGWAS